MARFVLLLLALPVAAGVHPDAPPETSQYAFLIGVWDCETRFMSGPGSDYREGRATWIGEYILDGWAVQDTWVSERPNGGRFVGINIRSFDREAGVWDNRWLPQGSLRWSRFESQMVGDTMVMIGGGGADSVGDYIDRNTFYDIENDRWSWRKDRSYDGGETWVTGIGFIEATRRKKEARESNGGEQAPDLSDEEAEHKTERDRE